MFTIGCHLSISKGFVDTAKTAQSLGGNTFQFFTGNPRGYSSKDWSSADIQEFNKLADCGLIGTIIAHAPYVYNLCAEREDIRKISFDSMLTDLKKLEALNDCVYNFHPGSHVGQGSEAGIDLISKALSELSFHGFTTPILLETMAGKGSEVGRSFEEIAAIISACNYSDNIGVCLDTCHIFDGGYDIVNNLNDVLNDFDRIIGIKKLKAIHLNDSKNTLSSHKDRHEKIGEGNIGLNAFIDIINHPMLQNIPFCLETPNENDGYAKEIALLKSYYKG